VTQGDLIIRNPAPAVLWAFPSGPGLTQ